MATTSDDKIVTNGVYDNYAEIVHSTNALSMTKVKTKPKANKG